MKILIAKEMKIDLSILKQSSNFEVILYTLLLLALWLLFRFFASSLSNIISFFGARQLKVDPFLNGVIYPVSYWTERGGRPYQEDRFYMMKAAGIDASLYGVFDGHGGHLAAQYCKEYLLQCIASDPEWESSPPRAISRSFKKVDSEFSGKAKAQTLNDGTTAIVAAFHAGKIYVGNAGDSRAIVVQKGGRCKVMSMDHRPDRKDEENRIKKLGGKIIYWGRWRVEGVLAVSRAIGDVSFQPYITAEPEIIEKSIEPDDEYLVLATDGLWDVMENEDVARYVLNSRKDFLNISKKLCSESLILGSSDNVTVLVIDIKKREIVHHQQSRNEK